MMKTFLLCLLSCVLVLGNIVLAKGDNPFGANVIIFDPSMDAVTINAQILAIYNQQKDNDFGNERYAFLFMPGNYGTNIPIDVRVGFYTSVLGVGRMPNDVVITGAVRTQDRNGSGVTTVFWRSVENLAIIPTLGSILFDDVPKDQNVWACSQACPMRRVRIRSGSLRLYDEGFSSGGFLADCRIDNSILSGTQQQFLVRNNHFGDWQGYNWNIVFVGNFGQIPQGEWPNPSYTIVAKTPLIKEKPYLYYNTDTQQWTVNLRSRRRNVAGTDWHIYGTDIPLSSFYIAQPSDTAKTLNSALKSGKQLFFPPGVYHLSDTIQIKRPGTIVFGIGFATLVSDNGKPVISVRDVESVQIAGIMIDAGATSTPTLMLVGYHSNRRKHTDPIFIYDIFCRVGGTSYLGQANSCMTINTNDVVLDDTWFWRADHGFNVGWFTNQSDNGLIANGMNIIVYNLVAEHFQKYQIAWNGENGLVFEFQSEAPYDVPDQANWMDGFINGYAAYKVADNIINHYVYAFGIYTNFQNPVWMDTAISVPISSGPKGEHVIGFWLNGNPDSGIRHMVNDSGAGVSQQSRRADIVDVPFYTNQIRPVIGRPINNSTF